MELVDGVRNHTIRERTRTLSLSASRGVSAYRAGSLLITASASDIVSASSNTQHYECISDLLHLILSLPLMLPLPLRISSSLLHLPAIDEVRLSLSRRIRVR